MLVVKENLFKRSNMPNDKDFKKLVDQTKIDLETEKNPNKGTAKKIEESKKKRQALDAENAAKDATRKRTHSDSDEEESPKKRRLKRKEPLEKTPEGEVKAGGANIRKSRVDAPKKDPPRRATRSASQGGSPADQDTAAVKSQKDKAQEARDRASKRLDKVTEEEEEFGGRIEDDEMNDPDADQVDETEEQGVRKEPDDPGKGRKGIKDDQRRRKKEVPLFIGTNVEEYGLHPLREIPRYTIGEELRPYLEDPSQNRPRHIEDTINLFVSDMFNRLYNPPSWFSFRYFLNNIDPRMTNQEIAGIVANARTNYAVALMMSQDELPADADDFSIEDAIRSLDQHRFGTMVSNFQEAIRTTMNGFTELKSAEVDVVRNMEQTMEKVLHQIETHTRTFATAMTSTQTLQHNALLASLKTLSHEMKEVVKASAGTLGNAAGPSEALLELQSQNILKTPHATPKTVFASHNSRINRPVPVTPANKPIFSLNLEPATSSVIPSTSRVRKTSSECREDAMEPGSDEDEDFIRRRKSTEPSYAEEYDDDDMTEGEQQLLEADKILRNREKLHDFLEFCRDPKKNEGEVFERLQIGLHEYAFPERLAVGTFDRRFGKGTFQRRVRATKETLDEMLKRKRNEQKK